MIDIFFKGNPENWFKEFLESLLKNKVKCLHDEKELKEILMGVRK